MEETASINRMSIKELKSFILQRGGSIAGCVEKKDLISVAESIASDTPFKMIRTLPFGSLESCTYGGVDCLRIKTCPTPKSAVILLHGYGADNEDLVPIGQEVLSSGKPTDQWWIFPNAIGSQPTGGREWWPLDLNQLLVKFMSGTLTEDVPPGLSKARDAMLSMMAHLCSDTGLSYSNIILGGFSQGAMLSTDVTLHLAEDLGGLVILSGLLICESEWRTLAEKMSGGLRVLQSHGTKDPLLAYPLALKLKALLEDTARASVQFISFDGVHTIPSEAVSALKSLSLTL